MGEADKHGVRRKIEEKQVMIREQRKVRAPGSAYTATLSTTPQDSSEYGTWVSWPCFHPLVVGDSARLASNLRVGA